MTHPLSRPRDLLTPPTNGGPGLMPPLPVVRNARARNRRPSWGGETMSQKSTPSEGGRPVHPTLAFRNLSRVRRYYVGRVNGIPVTATLSFIVMMFASACLVIVGATTQNKLALTVGAMLLAWSMTIGVHEYGHAVAAKTLGVPGLRVVLGSTGGMVTARDNELPPSTVRIVAAAGPLVGLVPSAVWGAASAVGGLAGQAFSTAALVGVLLTVVGSAPGDFRFMRQGTFRVAESAMHDEVQGRCIRFLVDGPSRDVMEPQWMAGIDRIVRRGMAREMRRE